MKNLLTLLFLLLYIKANAQIIYTDVNPDVTVTCANAPCSWEFRLDLNNDHITDFIIEYSKENVVGGGHCTGTRTSNYVTILPQGNNEVAVDSIYLPIALALGSSIGANKSFWKNDSLGIMAEHGYFCHPSYGHPPSWALINGGEWYNTQNRCLGLKFFKGGITYYGWARMAVPVDVPSFTVDDYAYNSIPDEGLLAGQTSITGIYSLINQEQILLSPNPASDGITLSFSSVGKKEIQITNVIGQIVFSEETNSSKEDIDVSKFPIGIYVVSVQSSSQKIEKKFFKQ